MGGLAALGGVAIAANLNLAVLQREPEFWLEENVKQVRALGLWVVHQQASAATAAARTADAIERCA